MIKILPAKPNDHLLLSTIGRASFLPAHGHSATPEIVEAYLQEKYSAEAFLRELSDPANIYHILYYDDVPVGYSKIILNASHPSIEEQAVTKLERLYILKEYYDKALGRDLFAFNVALSKEHQQVGIWLHVWVENPRAIKFYQKMGFKIIGSHDFRLSDDHSNPNHHMYLKY